jgi:hypothetical protein
VTAPTVQVRDVADVDRPWLRELVASMWGLPVVTSVRAYEDPERLDGVIADRARPRRMVEVLHRVTVRPDVEFPFGAAVDGADFVVVPELDRYNFEVLPALHIGKIACTEPNARNPSGSSAASAFPGDL